MKVDSSLFFTFSVNFFDGNLFEIPFNCIAGLRKCGSFLNMFSILQQHLTFKDAFQKLETQYYYCLLMRNEV